jgi:peptide/nickel transport system substrate-binding protein
MSIDDVTADDIVPGEDAVVTASVTGPGTLGVRYLLLDPAAGQVVASGQADPGDDGTFAVTIPADVTGTLFPGFYELHLALGSDSLARIAERRVDLEVAP